MTGLAAAVLEPVMPRMEALARHPWIEALRDDKVSDQGMAFFAAADAGFCFTEYLLLERLAGYSVPPRLKVIYTNLMRDCAREPAEVFVPILARTGPAPDGALDATGEYREFLLSEDEDTSRGDLSTGQGVFADSTKILCAETSFGIFGAAAAAGYPADGQWAFAVTNWGGNPFQDLVARLHREYDTLAPPAPRLVTAMQAVAARDMDLEEQFFDRLEAAR